MIGCVLTFCTVTIFGIPISGMNASFSFAGTFGSEGIRVFLIFNLNILDPMQIILHFINEWFSVNKHDSKVGDKHCVLVNWSKPPLGYFKVLPLISSILPISLFIQCPPLLTTAILLSNSLIPT